MVTAVGLAELPELLAIENAAFAPAERWSKPLWQAELAAAGLVVLAHTPTGAPAAAAVFRIMGESVDLFRIATLPQFRRQGYAAECLNAGIAWARSAQTPPVAAMLLEVRADNAPALAFYHHAGFKELSIRKNYYQDADALVLRLDLVKKPSGEGK
ncbi:MAG: GNAT family N-acetyltransferase [Propionibacteriaceae bacterium]|jgi:ribosomal-protein-alanine N-acetyltransferase|nr:GNAT family N-acetyltransferase [Propionibacteriaceae bacterium]